MTTYIEQSYIFTDDYIGRIVLSDGTFVSKENFNSSTMTPVAVVAGLKNDGSQIIAVGLQKGTSLRWAPSGTTGYNTKFTGIQGTETSGDMDGSDNWEYICSVDTSGTQDAKTNYPAFNYANTYGQTAGLTGTDFAYGWYLPAIAELKTVYDNKSVIQTSLDVVGGFTIGTSYYWSSTEYFTDLNFSIVDMFHWDFGNGYASIMYTKAGSLDVLVVQAFNAQ